MKIEEYKNNLKKQLSQRTVTFLLKKNKVLLGLKKRGFGKGYYVGIGGKLEENESAEQCAFREMKEEINVEAKKLNAKGRVIFLFPHVKDESWNQEVLISVVKEFENEPHESEEIRPVWFVKNKVPFELMWDDAKYWLPQILNGEKLEGVFIFDENLKVIEYNIV